MRHARFLRSALLKSRDSLFRSRLQSEKGTRLSCDGGTGRRGLSAECLGVEYTHARAVYVRVKLVIYRPEMAHSDVSQAAWLRWFDTSRNRLAASAVARGCSRNSLGSRSNFVGLNSYLGRVFFRETEPPKTLSNYYYPALYLVS